MEKFTITITRQFGSMGRTIARQLAEELGTEFYDRDIVEEVSRKLNLPVSQISESEEKSEYRFWSRMFPLGNDEANIQSSIFDAQKSIILDLAQKSSSIIVGRCSDAILEEANVENVINIYIYAPIQKRLENCITRLGMDEAEAKRTIAQVDKARDAYHKQYAGFLPSDLAHKQLMIDSSLLGPEKTAHWIAELIKERFGE